MGERAGGRVIQVALSPRSHSCRPRHAVCRPDYHANSQAQPAISAILQLDKTILVLRVVLADRRRNPIVRGPPPPAFSLQSVTLVLISELVTDDHIRVVHESMVIATVCSVVRADRRRLCETLEINGNLTRRNRMCRSCGWRGWG